MMNTAEPNSNVFVRVRPLSNEESKRNEVELDWLSSYNNALTKPSSHQPKAFKSFKNVLLKEAHNKAVYDTTVSRLLPSVFLGNSACCFCYGHTGSGKTHTILGYDEVGIYRYAIEEICSKLTADTSVQVSFAEIYEDKIYDLLNNRDPLFIREDENGQFLIRSQTTMTAAGEVFVKSLRSVVGRTPSEIFAIVNSGISNRISGSSGVHNQSSRSHAILIFEIVTDSLVKCREDIINAEAKIVPVGKARDGLFIKIQAGRYIKDDNGKYTVNPSYVEIPEDTRMLADLENSVASLQQDIDNAKLAAQNVLQSASPEVGGTLVFVDLAGSEYASDVNAVYAKSAKEKREAKQINQSLLALKECIRRSNDVHVPYRNSKLTMYLKPFLQHKETSFSMIANVSIAKSDEQKILSTLNYADLVAKAV
ncbi:hypothetical protein HK098_004618 [Nowakowskiella sp. JEL0407]|nr:hypothetical protein HK098_004618 [Nowakowskiella sp. JEL0407]